MCTCEICGESFGSKQAVGSHKTQAHGPDNPPWEDADTLRKLYVDEGKPMPEIADKFDIAMATVRYWMQEHSIKRRDKSAAHQLRHAQNDAPYKDESTLRQEYVENEKTMEELGDRWGCDPTTVANWLHRFGIEPRQTGDWQRQEYVSLWYTEQGYLYWKDHTPPSRGDSIPVHRLVAVSKYGIEAVKGKHVHHKNGVKWDNRPENLELRDPSDHARKHYERGDLKLEPGGIEELKNEVGH